MIDCCLNNHYLIIVNLKFNKMCLKSTKTKSVFAKTEMNNE